MRSRAAARLLPEFVSKNVTTGVLYLSAKGGTGYSPTSHDNLPDIDLEALSNGDTTTPSTFIDENGDGFDDVTGATPAPATPSPSPTPAAPGGGDDFSG